MRRVVLVGGEDQAAAVTRLELDLREYTHTRAAICESAISEAGRAGAHEAVAELRFIEAVRAIMDGQPLPTRGSE
jgi:hypothetical protein